MWCIFLLTKFTSMSQVFNLSAIINMKVELPGPFSLIAFYCLPSPLCLPPLFSPSLSFSSSTANSLSLSCSLSSLSSFSYSRCSLLLHVPSVKQQINFPPSYNHSTQHVSMICSLHISSLIPSLCLALLDM